MAKKPSAAPTPAPKSAPAKGKTEEDTPEDFANVYDFDEAFAPPQPA